MQFKINVYRGIIFVQSTEMEEKFSAFIYKNMQIGNKRIIATKTRRNIFSFISLNHMCQIGTHTH